MMGRGRRRKARRHVERGGVRAELSMLGDTHTTAFGGYVLERHVPRRKRSAMEHRM